jgi:zinc transporter 9
MSPWLLALLILVLSLAGGAVPILASKGAPGATMRRMTSLSGGVLLGSALLIIVPEGFHLAEEAGGDLPEVALGGAFLFGFLVMIALEGWGLGHSIHEEHHDHAVSHGHGHVHHPTASASLPIGLSVHAVADGVAVGAAAAGGQTEAAALIAVAVLLHKVPAAFSLGVFSAHERKTSERALQDVALFSLVTPAALVLASQFLSGESQWLALSLMFSAGTFLYVATIDALPSVHSSELGRRTALDVILGALAFAAVLVVLDLLGVGVELH